MNGRTGTEILTRDLALGLLRRGHYPIVYTTAAGDIANELRRASVPVATAIDTIGEHIDVIHGHHTPCAAVAISRFPDAAAIFVSHDFTAWHDVPPRFPSIKRYVAVDETVAARLTSEHGISREELTVVLNGVDTSRFLSGPALPQKPRRAIAFAKNFGHVEPIVAACKACGIELDLVGSAVKRIVEAPERMLGNYDLVFASALSALEAMMCGRAVIVCDGRGLAGFVTAERFQSWRPRNFGLRTLLKKVSVENLVTEIALYDATSAAAVGVQVREHASLDCTVSNYLEIYRQALLAPRRDERDDERARATARYLECWSPRADTKWPWIAEREGLLETIHQLVTPLQPARLSAPILFGMQDDEGLSRLLSGFSHRELSGVWTEGKIATLDVCFPADWEGDLLAIFDVGAFVPPTSPPMNVCVFVNGEMLQKWSFNPDYPGGRNPTEVILPARMVRAAHGRFVFEIDSPRTPRDYRVNEDRRALGIFLKMLVFKPVPSLTDDAISSRTPTGSSIRSLVRAMASWLQGTPHA